MSVPDIFNETARALKAAKPGRAGVGIKHKERIVKICAEILPCGILADIGCDHGYITLYAVKNKLCKKAVITDISQKSLEKANILLKTYIDSGEVAAYCTDGFTDIKERADTAVIAGMGGAEILSVLEGAGYLPQRLILQPMKNTKEVREALQKKYRFVKDVLFYCGNKYYNLLVLERGADILTLPELEFGRTNLEQPSADFMRYIESEREKTESYLKSSGKNTSGQLLQRLEILNTLQKRLGKGI